MISQDDCKYLLKKIILILETEKTFQE